MRPSHFPNLPYQNLNPKQSCHPDRSVAQWRDLQCALRPSRISRIKTSTPNKIVIPTGA